jgi:hypothetical protein
MTARLTMDDVRKRLDHNLPAALFRLRQLGGAVAVEELPGVIGDNSPFADEVDEIQANESRDERGTHSRRGDATDLSSSRTPT